MSNVECQMSNVNKVESFVAAYLRNFFRHFLFVTSYLRCFPQRQSSAWRTQAVVRYQVKGGADNQSLCCQLQDVSLLQGFKNASNLPREGWVLPPNIYILSCSLSGCWHIIDFKSHYNLSAHCHTPCNMGGVYATG